MTTQSDFDYAQAHPEMRSEFLRKLELYDKADLIAQVIYNPGQGGRREVLGYSNEPFMTTYPAHCGQSTIVVNAKAFESPMHIANVYDFMSCLIDHEYVHAQQNAAGFIHEKNIARKVCAWSVFKHMASRENWSLDAFEDLVYTRERCFHALKAIVEIPAHERQHDGRFTNHISAIHRGFLERNLRTYRDILAIVEQGTGMATEDMIERPGEFYTKMHKNRNIIARLAIEIETTKHTTQIEDKR